MTQIAKNHCVPLILVSPVSNLEWPPFKPEHDGAVAAGQQEKFAALLDEAGNVFGDDQTKAIGLLQEAAKIDDQNALVHYQLGVCYRDLGRMPEAEAELFKAKELDACPLRMLEPLHQRIHMIATSTGTPIVDAAVLVAARSRSGFPDNQWLIDHVHPKLEGHQLIAESLVIKMSELGNVQPASGWEQVRDVAYARHLQSLSSVYFEHGRQRLRSEQGWARGLVKRPRVESASQPASKSEARDGS
jgi:tetratricopeptide (TPR) repeat protein